MKTAVHLSIVQQMKPHFRQTGGFCLFTLALHLMYLLEFHNSTQTSPGWYRYGHLQQKKWTRNAFSQLVRWGHRDSRAAAAGGGIGDSSGDGGGGTNTPNTLMKV